MNTKKYSEAKLKDFDEIITQHLSEVKKQLELLSEIRNKRNEIKQDGNPGFGEMSKNEQQASKNTAAMRRLETRRTELLEAQIRIENATYGICLKSGELIDEKRLKAMPTAKFAILERSK